MRPIRGFVQMEREHRDLIRQRRMQRLGFWLFVLLMLLSFISGWNEAHAEPTNAPDTKGHFVLVVAGTASSTGGFSTQYLIQPFVIVGFTSFHQCRSAGMELQARLNTDGYTLDFSCIATSR